MKRLTDTTLPHIPYSAPVTVGARTLAVTHERIAVAPIAPYGSRGALVGGAVTNVRPIWALRLYAARKERRLSRISPLTVQVSEAHSTARRELYLLCMEDGNLNHRERKVLDAIDEAGRLFSLVDLARRTGDWIRDTGRLPQVADISPYLMREWKELHAAPDDAA